MIPYSICLSLSDISFSTVPPGSIYPVTTARFHSFHGWIIFLQFLYPVFCWWCWDKNICFYSSVGDLEGWKAVCTSIGYLGIGISLFTVNLSVSGCFLSRVNVLPVQNKANKNKCLWGLPWCSSDWDFAPNAGVLDLITGQGTRSHMRPLRDLACYNEDWRSRLPKLRPGAVK